MDQPSWTQPLPAGGAHVPVSSSRLLSDPALPVPAALWRDLGVPAALAYVTFDPAQRRWIATHPGPAGARQVPLPADAWGEVALAVPLVAALEPGRDALLVYAGHPRTVDGGRPADLDALVAPVDICRRLIDSLSVLWRGRHGGYQLWRAVDRFMVYLRQRARQPTDVRPETA